VFVTQPLADPLGRVPLLGWGVAIGDQDLIDDSQELAEHRLRPGNPLAITGRLPMGQDLLQRRRADPIVPSDRALRRAIDEHFAPDLSPHLHVGVHPFSRLLARPRREACG
jgi:hypothetical protein